MRSRLSLAAVLAHRLMAISLFWIMAAGVATPPAHAATRDAPGAGQHEDGVYRIGFHLWKPGKIYEEAMAGIMDGLQLEGIRFEPVILESGRDESMARENLRKLDGMGLDLIYSLSSAGTKIAKALNLKTPVIATVINHPASLGVGDDNGGAGTRLTGTSYYVDARKQLRLYRMLFPKAKKIGMIFDTRNPAGYLAEEPFMREACEAMGLEFVSVGVTAKSELGAAAKRLVEAKVDLVVIPTNRLVYANLELVLDVMNPRKVPIVSMNKQGVENGALAALYADTYDLGRQTTGMAARILRERADPVRIGFEYIPEPDVILNMGSADTLSYEFPANVLSSATIVLQ
ncbi:MAG: ABC transporter substrate-binding protein [Kiloniellaceae bacterium]